METVLNLGTTSMLNTYFVVLDLNFPTNTEVFLVIILYFDCAEFNLMEKKLSSLVRFVIDF